MIILFIISQWLSFLNSSEIYNISSYDDSLLIGTTGGALIFDKESLRFRHITNVDGLLSNEITHVGIDKYGNSWFLCAGGGITLISANRSRVEEFTYMERLPSYTLSSLFIDGDTVWVGTRDDTKVWMYDMQGDPFVPHACKQVNVEPSNEVNEIQVLGDSIWFGTNKGIGVTKKGESSFTIYDTSDGLPNDTILSIAEWGGYVWAGTKKGTARRITSGWEVVDSGDIKVYDFCSNSYSFWEATSFGVKKWDDGGWSQISSTDARTVLFDSQLWIGTFGNGITMYDGELHPYIPSGPCSNRFTSLSVDLNGNLWCTHGRDKGVSKLWYDEKEWKWKIYNREPWGPTARPNGVFSDRENNVWVIMFDWDDNIGVVKIMPNDSIIKFKIEGGENANCVVSAYIDDENSLWIGCHDGYIRRIRNDVIDTVIFSDYITQWPLAITFDREGNLWVGTSEKGLTILLKDGGVFRIAELSGKEISFIKADKSSGMWVGTKREVYKIVDKKIVVSYSLSDMCGVVENQEIEDMAIDEKGGVWFAVSDEGIKKLEPDGSFKTFGKEHGLVSQDPLKIEPYLDYLWIGTCHGLSRFDTGSPHPLPRVKVYPNPFILSKGHQKVFFESKDLKARKIHIYTLSGRLVKSITEIKSSFASWNGTNMKDEPVGSGIYIFVIRTADGKRKIGKIAVVR